MLLRHPFVTHRTIGADPLARPAAVAARRPLPPTSARPPDDQSDRPAPSAAPQPCRIPPRPRSPGGVALAAASGSGSGRLRRRPARRLAPDLRRRVGRPRGRDPHPRPRGAVRLLVGGETGRRRGLHGRPVVQPGPGRACSGSRPPTASRWRCRAAGSASRPSSRRTLAHRLPPQHARQSRRNIAAHYDLGNDFYRLFLDETMTYSSAVFASPDQSLADAQRNKYRRMASRRRAQRRPARPRDRHGLGRLRPLRGRRAGLPRDHDHDLAGAARPGRASASGRPGSTHLVDVQLRDYRDVAGTYDAIVSIEMLEAVGAEYFATFFETCDRALRAGRPVSLQSITFPDAAYERQLRGANWIQTYIFPGGLCPSLAVIERATRDTRLLITGVDRHRGRLRPDAARLADAVPARSTRSARWASTSGSSGCGTTTSPSARRASRPVSQDLQIVLRRRAGSIGARSGLNPGRDAPGSAAIGDLSSTRGGEAEPFVLATRSGRVRRLERLPDASPDGAPARPVCLVTGSTGIAAASARRLAPEGAPVFVVSRTADHARALADELIAAEWRGVGGGRSDRGGRAMPPSRRR